MKPTKSNLLLFAATCGLMFFATLGLQAQTLPVTSGLQLWLNADVGVTTNASGQVTAWADQSGLGNNATQANTANAPTLTYSALNGHRTLRFINPQYLDVPNANGIDMLTNDVTVLTVAKYDDLSGYRGVVSKCVSGNPAPFDWWNNASQTAGQTSFWLADAAGPAIRFRGIVTPPVGAYMVMGFAWKNGVVDQFLNDFNNGHAVNSISPTNGNSTLRIGRRPDNTVQLVGNVAEVLIYRPALSEADVYNVITNYLQPKYALVFDIPPTVSITSPANETTAAAGTTIATAISVLDADGYVKTLSVYGNGTLLGTASAPNTNNSCTYQLNVSVLYPGQMMLTAVATDNWGRSVTSAPVAVTVSGAVPALVTNALSVWLAADAGITTNAAGAVTNWTDQSLTGNDAVPSDETTAPLWVPNVVNGKPALRFNGTSQFLQVSDTGTAFLTTNFSTFAVARFNSFPNSPKQMVWTKTLFGRAAPIDWWIQSGGGPQVFRGDGTSFVGPVYGSAVPAGQFVTVGLAADGTTFTHYLQAAPTGAGSLDTSVASGGLALSIGRRDDGGTQMNGDLAELLIYNQALSDSDRSNVVLYLCAKYSLVLPAYASPPPVVNITYPTNGAVFAAPASPVNFTAAPSSLLGSIVSVTLSANGKAFGTLTSPPYQVPLSFLTPGTVTLTAVALDNWGAQSSTSVTITVTGSGSAPLPASGLRLQLAADAGVTLGTGNTVTAWSDQSLNGNDAFTYSSDLPTLLPGALNGKPVIHFTNSTTAGGSPQQYMEVSAANLGFLAGDCSTFVLGKFLGSSFRTVLSKTMNNNKPAPIDWYVSSAGVSTMNRGNGSAVGGVNGTVAVPQGIFGAVGCSSSGQAVTHYLGYNLNGSGTITAAVQDQGYNLRIGRRMDNGTFGNHDLAEVLIYDHAVSDAERKQILDYLYYKWGICDVESAAILPGITLASPTNGTAVSAPGVLSVVAQVTAGTYPIRQVEFLANGNTVYTRTAVPYQFPLEVLTPGTLTLQARVTDFLGLVSNTPPVMVTVTGSCPSSPPASGLVLWLKADAGVSTNADGTVAAWADQSGNGNNAAADPTYGFPTPLLVMDALSGRPALNFDGTVRYLDVASSANLGLTNDLSLFYAASFDDFSAINSVCSKCSLAQPHPFDYYINTSARAVLARGDLRGTGTIASSGALPIGTNVVGGVTVQGSLATHFLQGLANGAGSYQYGAVDDGTPLRIGSRDSLDIYLKGNLGELLIYDCALAGAGLQQANTYLAGRYGVATFQPYAGAPSLSVAKATVNTVQVSWLPGFAGYILEGRTNLASGAWMPLATNPPNNQFTLGATNIARFFRLRSQ